ncbi:hypothetical protein T05_11957 [Trichinella murrelli]|uniref:Uncharacterized protein n=1 Tax=Trichinella murrelli TaxID=144512 RepID=A0A0V0UHD1_9BILA|nr:hypothetical protein T05_11957 [Trichinella murrelli]
MFRPSNLPHTICYSADTEHLFSWKKRQIMIAFKRLICCNRITLIRCDCQKFVEQVVHLPLKNMN